MKKVWDLEKKHKNDKLNNNKNIAKPPDELEGIPVSDDKLEEMFGEPSVEPVVLGGIEASENVKNFLKLPLKFRLFPKINVKNAQIEVESKACKQRWSLKDKYFNGNETPEERLERKEKENRKREPLQGNKVNFGNVRVTRHFTKR